jgi:fructokinase
MKTVVTIGDCIFDAIEQPDGSFRTYPGGAGLNLAVGLSHLGLNSTLLSRVGSDLPGLRLQRYLRDRRVRLINTPNVDATGSATSRRIRGEPTYVFSSDLRRRRYLVGSDGQAAFDQAAAISVNSYPFDNLVHAADLAERLAAVRCLVFVDPNPRSDLIVDIGALREGVTHVAESADVLKLSEEDACLLFGCADKEAISALCGRGSATIVLTRGPKGAVLFARNGLTIETPVAWHDTPIIDTMGAGDAAMASIVATSVAGGLPRNAESWGSCLERAMQIASATCRREGGELVIPTPEIVEE